MAEQSPAPPYESEWTPGMLRLRLQGQPEPGAITATFLRFGVYLRARGLPATTGRMIELLRTIDWLDLHSPDELYWASRTLLTERVSDLAVFDKAFFDFFQPPKASGEGNEMMRSPHAMPRVLSPQEGEKSAPMPSLDHTTDEEQERSGTSTRSDKGPRNETERGHGEGSGLLSYTGDEMLRQKDFGNLTPDELRAAKKMLREMNWRMAERRSRRLVRARKGRHVDWRRSLRRNIGYGGVILELDHQRRKIVRRPLVVIADISGSMDRYTRPVLQLVHTMRTGHGRVEAFVFGTRLTRVTRHLQTRDPDAALRKMSDAVVDWAGGTRIGDSLRIFNRTWARRILGRGSVVIILSDGWDRGDPDRMSKQMAALQRRCHRLIWLNPVLGGPSTRPVPLGFRAAMPYIDDLMPARNLQDLAQVGKLLNSIKSGRADRRGAQSLLERTEPGR